MQASTSTRTCPAARGEHLPCSGADAVPVFFHAMKLTVRGIYGGGWPWFPVAAPVGTLRAPAPVLLVRWHFAHLAFLLHLGFCIWDDGEWKTRRFETADRPGRSIRWLRTVSQGGIPRRSLLFQRCLRRRGSQIQVPLIRWAGDVGCAIHRACCLGENVVKEDVD